MKIHVPSFIAAIGFLTISTILLTLPGSTLPDQNWMGKIGFDKWVHMGMFAMLVWLWCWAIYKSSASQDKTGSRFIVVMIFFIVYGIAMEIVQREYVPNRSFDTWDIAADTAGTVIGFIFSRMRYIKR